MTFNKMALDRFPLVHLRSPRSTSPGKTLGRLTWGYKMLGVSPPRKRHPTHSLSSKVSNHSLVFVLQGCAINRCYGLPGRTIPSNCVVADVIALCGT
jgi:hypothetical protein